MMKNLLSFKLETGKFFESPKPPHAPNSFTEREFKAGILVGRDPRGWAAGIVH
jgi:hypothetical protein